jgi:hypothetical protein
MNYAERSAWLATLKVGDKVCVADGRGCGARTYTIYTIERVIATQLISSKHNGLSVPYEVRFRKKDGQIVGSDSHASIEPLTDKVLEANERARLEGWLSGIKPKGLSMECLRAMKQAHDQNGGAA